MSTAAVATRVGTKVVEGAASRKAERTHLSLVEDACSDCGQALAPFEEGVCASCTDLAAHAWCRDCGAVLADTDLDAGACADCTA